MVRVMALLALVGGAGWYLRLHLAAMQDPAKVFKVQLRGTGG